MSFTSSLVSSPPTASNVFLITLFFIAFFRSLFVVVLRAFWTIFFCFGVLILSEINSMFYRVRIRRNCCYWKSSLINREEAANRIFGAWNVFIRFLFFWPPRLAAATPRSQLEQVSSEGGSAAAAPQVKRRANQTNRRFPTNHLTHLTYDTFPFPFIENMKTVHKLDTYFWEKRYW